MSVAKHFVLVHLVLQVMLVFRSASQSPNWQLINGNSLLMSANSWTRGVASRHIVKPLSN